MAGKRRDPETSRVIALAALSRLTREEVEAITDYVGEAMRRRLSPQVLADKCAKLARRGQA